MPRPKPPNQFEAQDSDERREPEKPDETVHGSHLSNATKTSDSEWSDLGSRDIDGRAERPTERERRSQCTRISLPAARGMTKEGIVWLDRLSLQALHLSVARMAEERPSLPVRRCQFAAPEGDKWRPWGRRICHLIGV